jgi:ribonuclease BN (tRNA processing enzyme)
MRLHFLGTRGNTDRSAPYHARNSGLLVDEKVLFDMGERDFLSGNLSAILITHLHPDHAFFVKEGVGKMKVPVYAPERSDDIEINIIKDKPFQIGEYRIIPVPSIHSKLVKSFSYIIETERRILYTGDLVWIEKKYHSRFGKLDLVISDGSYMRRGGFVMQDEDGNIWGHKGIPGLVRLFKDYTAHMVFTHFGAWFYEKGAEKAREMLKNLSESVRIEAAYDGMVMEI